MFLKNKYFKLTKDEKLNYVKSVRKLFEKSNKTSIFNFKIEGETIVKILLFTAKNSNLFGKIGIF